MAILSRTTLSTMLAAAMLAGSSFAFAADNKNSNNNNNSVGNEQTGSIRDNSGADTPDQADIERCQMAPVDDPTCVGVPRQ